MVYIVWWWGIEKDSLIKHLTQNESAIYNKSKALPWSTTQSKTILDKTKWTTKHRRHGQTTTAYPVADVFLDHDDPNFYYSHPNQPWTLMKKI